METDVKVATLEVVILYDNIDAGKCATALCHRVVATLGPEYELQLHCWRLAMLGSPPVAALVARETARSPCLVVAIDGRDALAPSLKEFLNGYIRAMPIRTALVAQLHGIVGNNEKLSPGYRCLNQIAQDAGIPFFSEAIPAIDGALECSHGAIRSKPKLLSQPKPHAFQSICSPALVSAGGR